ncbi:hypothetical protein [Nocardioides campestrisoli]|uniref:hypothetical protein n=1 Tax=Nocardioides campestrisoli TaxID=2736757 RepID=UPI0015E73A6E|nr:hypothetical protein [Nocardioides campestrisoli]
MTLCYPRLTRSDATAVYDDLRSVHASGGRALLRERVAFDHEGKVPVATGRIATPQEVRGVRRVVEEEVAPWLEMERVTSDKDKAEFDAALGRSLHAALDIVPADAAHEGTWSFLTLVVFPDVAAARFPDFHIKRFIGAPRNALRRPWQRQEILGDLAETGRRPLGEDELVGLFERTALVRNRRLARALAARVLAYDGPNRSNWARDLYKLATFQSGIRLLDALDDAEIEGFTNALSPSPHIS